MGCETGFFASMQSGIHSIGFWRVSDAWKPLVRHFRVVLDWYPNHQIRSHVRVLCRTCEPSNRAPSHRPSSSRSEEHTSELQSPDHLVCRLLLEKKKRI